MRGIGAMGMNGWILGDFKSLERDTPSKGELGDHPFLGKGPVGRAGPGFCSPGSGGQLIFLNSPVGCNSYMPGARPKVPSIWIISPWVIGAFPISFSNGERME